MNRFGLCLLSLLFFPLTAHCEDPKQSATFKLAEPGMTLSFPRDHGAHPDYATEWWYFTGHLTGKPDNSHSRRFGFQLTFFRVGLDGKDRFDSNWNQGSIYLAHFTITDDSNQRFYQADERSRATFNEAGAELDRLKVWLKDWRAEMVDDSIQLSAHSETESISLVLRSAKPVTLHGDRGFSKKGPNLGDASYYSSFTRLTGNGLLKIGKERVIITDAQAWMDHEFSSSSLSRDELGWDWFAIQLQNGEEIMLYQLRRSDGTVSPFSAGTWIGTDGIPHPLKFGEFKIESFARWTSEMTKVSYPSQWRISIPSRDAVFEINPTVQNQELVTERSTGVTYWEGRSLVKGSLDSSEISGDAYVELVGYSKPLK